MRMHMANNSTLVLGKCWKFFLVVNTATFLKTNWKGLHKMICTHLVIATVLENKLLLHVDLRIQFKIKCIGALSLVFGQDLVLHVPDPLFTRRL